MRTRLAIILCMLCVTVHVLAQEKDFWIARHGTAARIIVDDHDWMSVTRAAHDLSDDIRKVTGTSAEVTTDHHAAAGAIVIGTIGKSRLIDGLVRSHKLDVSAVSGQWESFVIEVTDGSLVIAGSDKRGTIYGIYELSRRIGVSPWYWWADVPVAHQDNLCYQDGRFVQPSPKVRYRGIFINDEDWGLKPWASTNYEKDLGDIGPKTYARVCELLLRLKANMLAPAMHSCTGAFYSHPESKVVADSFGIIITTSHCEPLLLNNAAESEWNETRDGDWNYKTNRETIWKKWDDRLSEASQYENIYTVAMRGVHDAGLRGNLPMKERVLLIDTVIHDQRQLLETHIRKRAEDIPQIFVPYKETMDIYENGLQVPDDITLVWVDDNYGYMKRVSSPEEQKRSGRAGIYYHLSYLGAPHDYLWLNTTPPVLMYEELKKAYDHGANRYWLLNVGDIKPMETGIQTFMEMAWDIDAFDFDNVNRHQSQTLASLFGTELEQRFQSVLDTYYRLAWSRKPEFMGWEREWDTPAYTGLRPTDFSFTHYDEAQQRLADYQRISDEVEQIGRQVRVKNRQLTPSFFELIQFPVQGAHQMNRKFLMAQLNKELLEKGLTAQANWAARQMELACDSINALNQHYNKLLDHKWNGMMDVPPGFCALYQERPEVIYTEGAGEHAVDLTPCSTAESGYHVVALDRFSVKSDEAQLIRGLGYDWQVMQLGKVSYQLPAIAADSVDVLFYAVPFWPLHAGKSNRITVSMDGGTPRTFENRFIEYSRAWKDQVLRNGVACRMRFAIDKSAATHTITFHAPDTGQMLQKVIIDWGGLQPSYLGPSPQHQ